MAVIDVHTHMMSPVWVEAIGKDETYGLTEVNGKRMIALGGRPYMPVEDEMLDYDRRIKDMDAAGLDLATISPTTPSVYWADEAAAASLALQLAHALEQLCISLQEVGTGAQATSHEPLSNQNLSRDLRIDLVVGDLAVGSEDEAA